MQNTTLITGADRGLGSALCAGLLARGWRVLAGQYMPDWPELDALAAQYPGSLHIVPLDVGSTASVQAAARQVAHTVDRIDLLISNAGIGSGRSELGQGLDTPRMLQAFNVNAVGAIRVVEASGEPAANGRTPSRFARVAGGIRRCQESRRRIARARSRVCPLPRAARDRA